TRAMTSHMQSAFPTADFHFHCDAETWANDVINEKQEPVNGLVKVPEGPGLGVTLDREALKRAKDRQLPEQKKWIIKSEFQNGTRMLNLANSKDYILMVCTDSRRTIPMNYASTLYTD